MADPSDDQVALISTAEKLVFIKGNLVQPGATRQPDYEASLDWIDE
jgi:hypothetical protein